MDKVPAKDLTQIHFLEGASEFQTQQHMASKFLDSSLLSLVGKLLYGLKCNTALKFHRDIAD